MSPWDLKPNLVILRLIGVAVISVLISKFSQYYAVVLKTALRVLFVRPSVRSPLCVSRSCTVGLLIRKRKKYVEQPIFVWTSPRPRATCMSICPFKKSKITRRQKLRHVGRYICTVCVTYVDIIQNCTVIESTALVKSHLIKMYYKIFVPVLSFRMH